MLRSSVLSATRVALRTRPAPHRALRAMAAAAAPAPGAAPVKILGICGSLRCAAAAHALSCLSPRASR